MHRKKALWRRPAPSRAFKPSFSAASYSAISPATPSGLPVSFRYATASSLACRNGALTPHALCCCCRSERALLLRSGRLRQMIHQAGKKSTTVGAAERGLDVVLRVRHESEHVAALVGDAGDRRQRPVDVPFR